MLLIHSVPFLFIQLTHSHQPHPCSRFPALSRVCIFERRKKSFWSGIDNVDIFVWVDRLNGAALLRPTKDDWTPTYHNHMCLPFVAKPKWAFIHVTAINWHIIRYAVQSTAPHPIQSQSGAHEKNRQTKGRPTLRHRCCGEIQCGCKWKWKIQNKSLNFIYGRHNQHTMMIHFPKQNTNKRTSFDSISEFPVKIWKKWMKSSS